MVQRFIRPLFFILLMAISSSAWATDYYVSTTGNDSDAGTIGAPFLTIQKGIDSATSAGDRVLINDGTYPSGISITQYDGSAEATKNIEGISSGATTVITVSSHGYSNGDRVEILGLEDPVTNGMVNLTNQWFVVANATANTFEVQTSTGAAVDSTLFDPYVTGGTVARIHPITVKAINRGSVIIDNSNVVGGWSNSGQPANTYVSTTGGLAGTSQSLWKVGTTILLKNQASAAAVTQEGYSYYNSATGVFTIYTTSNPNSSVYKQFSATNAGVLKGVSYNEVDGIIFQYSNVPFLLGYSSGFPTPPGQDAYGPTSHNRIQYCTAQYAGTWGMAVQTAATNLSTYNTIDRCTIQYVDEKAGGQNGHCFKNAANNNADNGSHDTVSNSTIHDCKYHGIQSSNAWADNFFYGNRIYNTSLSNSGSGADIRCGYSGDVNRPMACRIFDNDLGGGSGGTGTSQGTGIYIQDTDKNTKIWRNRIHDHAWHGIYLFYAGTGPTGPRDLTVWNNLIYNNKTAGIRGDSCQSNNQFLNNSLYNNGEQSIYGIGAGLSINNAFCSGIIFKNNIVSSATAASIRTTNSYQLTSDYNDLYTASGFKVIWNNTTYTDLPSYQAATLAISGFQQDAHSVTGDPLYGDPNNGDFRIPSPLTPADSSGTNLSSTVPQDYTTETREVPFDMGAYNTQGNLVLFPQVTLGSYFPGASGTVSISFTTSELTVNKDWKIVFTFPADFVLNNGGSTVAQNFTHMDGTFTTSVVGQVVTITRNNDGTNSAPNTYTFDLTHVKNPETSGRTGKYSISLNDSSDVMQGESLLFQDSLITQLNPGAISGATINGATLQ